MRRTNNPPHASRGGEGHHGHVTSHASVVRATPNRRAVWVGFAAGIVGYLLLSYQQPAGWGEGLWAGFALLLVPAIAGFVVNRAQGQDRAPRQAFSAGMRAAGWAMLFYAFITLIVLARRVEGSGDGGQEFLAGLLVTVVYTLFAGTVAGIVNLTLTRIATNRGSVKAAATGGKGGAPVQGEDNNGPPS
jgi:hypothetical protein